MSSLASQGTNGSTDTLLREMRGLITERLYNALTNPEKPPRASTIQAAIAWMRLTGHVEDPDDGERARREAVAEACKGMPRFGDGDPASLGGDPASRAEDERQKLADAVQHAVESMGDSEDDDSTDF